MPIEHFNLSLRWAEMIAPGVRHLAFAREDGQVLSYIPGQFISIHFEHAGEELKRSYSIAAHAGDSVELEIAASYVEGGAASELLFGLQPGDSLQASGPYGRLILRDEHPKRYILVATGTGVTPYRAMLPTLAALMSSSTVEVVLVFGVQYREQCLYSSEFVEFAESYPHFQFRAHFSRDTLSDAKPHEFKGYVQSSFPELELNPEQDVVYLCGNPNMIDESFEQLKAMGFDNRSVRREKYISGK